MRYFIWASYFMYFLGGMVSVVFGAVMPQWLAYYHASYTTGGVVVLLQACGFMLGVPLTTVLMNRLHHTYLLAGAAFAVGLAQIMLTLTPPIFVVYGLVILNGIGASALETAVASYVMEVFVGQRAVYMSRLEVAFGAGALVTPGIASIFIHFHVWRLAFSSLGFVGMALTVIWLTVHVNLHETTDVEQLDAKSADPPRFAKAYIKYSVLLLFLLLIFVYVGLEGSLNNFLPLVFTTYLKTSPANASLSVSVMWLAMVGGRMAIGHVVRRVNYERYVLWSIVTTVLFLAALTQVPWVWLCYVLVFGLGLGMSAIYSLTMVYANHMFPGMARSVTSLVTLFAGIGGAVFPGITGYAMDHVAPSGIPWLFVSVALVLFIILMAIFSAVAVARRSVASTGVIES